MALINTPLQYVFKSHTGLAFNFTVTHIIFLPRTYYILGEAKRIYQGHISLQTRFYDFPDFRGIIIWVKIWNTTTVLINRALSVRGIYRVQY